MIVVKVISTHIALYLGTYSVLDFVEDNLTASGTVAVFLLGFSTLLSLLANLWACGGFAEPSRAKVVRAVLMTALISPLSAVFWLTVYANIVGYPG